MSDALALIPALIVSVVVFTAADWVPVPDGIGLSESEKETTIVRVAVLIGEGVFSRVDEALFVLEKDCVWEAVRAFLLSVTLSVTVDRTLYFVTVRLTPVRLR